jgi:hypothetical protein
MARPTGNYPAKTSEGTRTKLTPKMHEALVAAAKKGLGRRETALLVGLNPSVLWRWGKYASEGREPFASLIADMEEAEAALEAEMVGLVHDAARASPAHWTAAMTFLERRYPDRYSKREAVTIEGNPDRPVITRAIIGDSEALEKANELLELLASRTTEDTDIEDAEFAEVDDSTPKLPLPTTGALS